MERLAEAAEVGLAGLRIHSSDSLMGLRVLGRTWLSRAVSLGHSRTSSFQPVNKLSSSLL